MDQASGLRQRVLQRSGARESIEVPLIRAHIRVTGTESIEVPSGSLIWHWRPTARAATGWDLQARFHVCGLPNQFSTVELSQWRYLAHEWHLIGAVEQCLPVADCVMLWLPSHGVGSPSLLPLVRRWLTWLCRNTLDIPIILAGTTAVARRRLTHWAGVKGMGTPRGEWESLPEPETSHGKRRGYYRLLQLCRDHPVPTEYQHGRMAVRAHTMEVWKR
jgi:hypothetical protein